MSTEFHNIAIVDDDPAVRDSLTTLLEAAGHTTKSFKSGNLFLETEAANWQGCVLLDVRMPGKDGLTVLQEALALNPALHIVMMSGHGDIPMAVKALRLGAHDFIEKPFQASTIMAVMEKTCADLDRLSKQGDKIIKAEQLIALLTPREIEVAKKLGQGKPNKIVSFELDISVRTVETHRARVMSKLRIQSLAELVRILIDAGALDE